MRCLRASIPVGRYITIWPRLFCKGQPMDIRMRFTCGVAERVAETRPRWLSRFRADTPQSSTGVKLRSPPSYHMLCARKVGNSLLYLFIIIHLLLLLIFYTKRTIVSIEHSYNRYKYVGIYTHIPADV